MEEITRIWRNVTKGFFVKKTTSSKHWEKQDLNIQNTF